MISLEKFYSWDIFTVGILFYEECAVLLICKVIIVHTVKAIHLG